jgi:hypothetical protein
MSSRPVRDRPFLTHDRMDVTGAALGVPAALPCCGLRGDVVTSCPDPRCQRCAERFWQGLVGWVGLRRRVGRGDRDAQESARPPIPPDLQSVEAWIAANRGKTAENQASGMEIAPDPPRSAPPRRQGDLSGLVELV